jgi:Tol biopolymer transport system component
MEYYRIQMPSIDLSTQKPNFSHLSDKIVFLYDKEVWVIQSDLTLPEKIISIDLLVASPVWSPVEDCIVYCRTPYNNKKDPSELVLFNYETKSESVILSDKRITFIDNIKWSSNGQQLAFHNIDEPNIGTFIINKNGTGLKRISDEQFPFHDWYTE